MVHVGAPARLREARALLLSRASRGRVDDGRAARPSGRAERLGEGRVHAERALAAAVHLDRPQRQVGSRETLHELWCIRGQAEARKDLIAHHRRGGRGCRQHADVGQVGEEPADLEILGPEVVPPLADAVGFVHRHERTAKLFDEGSETGEGQPLRGDVDQPALAARDQAHAPSHLARVDGGGQVGRRNASRVERLDLVLHE